MSVVEAVERDLKRMGGDLADSALAASALALAARIDDPRTSSTSVSMCARALNETLDKLRALAPPPEKQEDRVDEIAKRRQRRHARAAG